MNKYSLLSPSELESHLSGFLLDHLSVSAVRDFVRNEKYFEQKYIFKDYSDDGDGESQVAGTVYHQALAQFFRVFDQEGRKMSYEEMTELAFEELDKHKASSFKPYVNRSMVEVKQDCEKHVLQLIENFLAEVDIYLSDVEKIVFVEVKFTEFIVLNGIDIPVPFTVIPDLIYVNKEGYLCGLDHKAKKNYTKEKEAPLKHSYQSICYARAVETVLEKHDWCGLAEKYPKIKEGFKKFKFFENKYTMNRDRSPQIKASVVDMTDSAFYESIFFEPVWRVINAIQDPDYVYLMNPDDYFANAEKLLDFWVKSRMEELDSFQGLNAAQKKILSQKKTEIKKAALAKVPKVFVDALKGDKDLLLFDPSYMEAMTVAEKVEYRLRCFGFQAKVAHIVQGYSCDTLLLQVGVGTKTNQIHSYRLDIANVLGVEDVRISDALVKYQGESFLAVEVNRESVRPAPLTQEVLRKLSGSEIPLGMDNFGNAISWDMGDPSTPHMMISGASGSGKSFALKNMIKIALKSGHRVTVIDPKFDDKFEGLSCEIIHELPDIEAFIEGLVKEMDEIFKSKKKPARKHVIIFDEVADCLTRQTSERRIGTVIGEYADGRPKTAVRKDPNFKTLEDNLLILAQKARSAGIHLVLAAQRFSVKILTGDVKANFTTRLALTAAKKADSLVMIDEEGAESLRGAGDGLLVSPKLKNTTRIQCFTF